MQRDPSLDPQLTVDSPVAMAESILDGTGTYEPAPTTEPAVVATARLSLPSIPGYEIAGELARGGDGARAGRSRADLGSGSRH